MKRFLVALLSSLPMLATAADYQSTLLVQTGKLTESDLVVRTITDLESSRICLAFYVRTVGTSSVMTCFDAAGTFQSRISQTGQFKEGKLVVRKIKDTVNNVSCLVTYVSTEGTSPAIDCYKGRGAGQDEIVRKGHLREGDLDIYRIVDSDTGRACLVTYVNTGSTSPALVCYNDLPEPQVGGLLQSSQLREGDLVVRKIIDEASRKECLVTYVSTEGTSPSMHCSDTRVVPPPATAPGTAPAAAAPAKP
jgi:hypothetical protein